MASQKVRESSFCLRNISLSFDPEMSRLWVIKGRVGSGKSMMLMALLGQEIPIINGKYSNPYVGTIPYASQTPVILPSSLRENITFGESYVEDALQRALKGAALLPDMQQLPNNDLTEIGEHGVNLSGGQRGSPGICTGAVCSANEEGRIRAGYP